MSKLSLRQKPFRSSSQFIRSTFNSCIQRRRSRSGAHGPPEEIIKSRCGGLLWHLLEVRKQAGDLIVSPCLEHPFDRRKRQRLDCRVIEHEADRQVDSELVPDP